MELENWTYKDASVIIRFDISSCTNFYAIKFKVGESNNFEGNITNITNIHSLSQVDNFPNKNLQVLTKSFDQ